MRLLLVSRRGPARKAYQRVIDQTGVSLDTVSSLEDMIEAVADQPYHGLLLDLPTLVRSSPEEKNRVHDWLELFPVVRLNYDGRSGEIKALYYGRSGAAGDLLQDFIEKDCPRFNPRVIRITPRIPIHYNVELFDSCPKEEEGGERTYTVNVSEGGCFVMSGRDWDGADIAWVRIPDLTDRQPIKLGIKWYLPWGKERGIPGIGASFLEITEKQTEEIQGAIERV